MTKTKQSALAFKSRFCQYNNILILAQNLNLKRGMKFIKLKCYFVKMFK